MSSGSKFLLTCPSAAFETVSAGTQVELLKKATCNTVPITNKELYLVMGASGTEVIVNRSFRSAWSSTSFSFLVSPPTSGRVALLLQVSPPSGLRGSGGAVAHTVQHSGLSPVSGRPGWLCLGTAVGKLLWCLVEPQSGSGSRLELWSGRASRKRMRKEGRIVDGSIIWYFL